jgi:hypothetical protein
LKTSENLILRIIFGLQRKEATGLWRKSMMRSFFLPFFKYIRTSKPRTMRRMNWV